MGFHERCKAEWANAMMQNDSQDANCEPCKVTISKCYSKDVEDAIIDIANGRQPKTNVMFDMLGFDEMLANVRKYGREGIYMETEAHKEFNRWLKSDSNIKDGDV